MLKKIIARIFNHNSDTPSDPHIVPAGRHPIKPGAISKAAAKVVEVLEENGYQAYVVGGCVRDLLLKLHPKDFDVATNATPEQVNSLFRRSRLIGRRFQIVHVHIGREMVEVTTFRAHHDGNGGSHSRQSDQGLLLRDNVFGDINEDALRRDFTVNALYYHPTDNTIYDYANGMADIQARQLRIIGDPEKRFREDPVRMLRAARFAAKLGFTIEPGTHARIRPLAPLLAEIPPARLFDEFLKLFLSGHALSTFNLLCEHGLFDLLFPGVEARLDENDGFYRRFIEQALVNTDQRIRTNKRVTPAFLLAAILWPLVEKQRDYHLGKGEVPAMAIQKAGGKVIADQVDRLAIPRRFSMPMREIWDLQLRLPQRHGNRAEHLASLPRFRAGYDFVLLREEAGEDLDGLGMWWTRYQDADETARQKMVEALGKPRSARRRRKPRTRKPVDQ